MLLLIAVPCGQPSTAVTFSFRCLVQRYDYDYCLSRNNCLSPAIREAKSYPEKTFSFLFTHSPSSEKVNINNLNYNTNSKILYLTSY